MTNVKRFEPVVNQRILGLCHALKHRFVDLGKSFDFADWTR